MLQVPADRLGHVSQHRPFTAQQLKILQATIRLVVFSVLAIAILGERPRPDDCLAFLLVLATVAVAMSDRVEG